MLTANRREAGFRATNGELVTVSGVDEQGRIQLQDGRVLPEAYRHFNHGYAVTAHRSQGKSVDAVIISSDAMKKELFYVAASRGRESVIVVTSDRELLRESVTRSGARQSASELARKVQRCRAFQRGELRGLSAARRLARYAAVQSERVVQRIVPTRELGSGLASLLSDLAAQQVTRLKEPTRVDRFANITGSHITEFHVHKAEQTGDS